MNNPTGQDGQCRGVFAVNEDTALAALEEAWAAGGYHALPADDGLWSAISSNGTVLTGQTPDELGQQNIRADWQELQ